MKKSIYSLICASSVAGSPAILADNEQQVEELKEQIVTMQSEFDQRIDALENSRKPNSGNTGSNSFNPEISLILDGTFASYKNNPDDYQLVGFPLGGEAGLAPEGFAIGHTELTMSANVDDKFYGQFTMALHEHESETEVEVEEAFINTLGLGQGFTIRAGRFFSSVGYINQQHDHAWDFSDAPLVYAGMWGNKYIDDGIRLSWVAPTDLFWELGAEAFAGSGYPAGGEPSSNIGSKVLFSNIGGDFNTSHSWQAGVSYFTADVDDRHQGSHSHGAHDHDDASEESIFSGDSDIWGANFIYKWAPNGNYKNRNFKLQGEYFHRDEKGDVAISDHGHGDESSYKGKQNGYYVQAIYQFMPQWAAGIRYDELDSNNKGADMHVIEEAGLYSDGYKPKRYSAMAEWLPSEFSRVRLQYNRDESYQNTDNQIIVQYTMSLGSHGAHTF